MSMIDLLRSHESNADQILITVQAGTDPKKLSIRVGKSERLGWITNSVKLNMKTFEHVFPTQIYFCDSVSGEVLGVETPLAPYHGKVLIARVKAGLCEDLFRSCLIGCGIISGDEDANANANSAV